MSKALKELIRQILTEAAKDTGMTTSQWWEQKGVEYTGGDADEPYFVYIDETGEEVIGKKGGTGDPFTYKDLGNGRVLVTSGPSAKSVGAIVSRAGAARVSSTAGAAGTPVPKKPSAIADYIKKMSAGLADMLGVIERFENLRSEIVTGQSTGLSLSLEQKQKIFSEQDSIEDFMTHQVAVPISNALKAVSAIAQGLPAEMPQFGTLTGTLAKVDPKIGQLIASGAKNINDAIKSLKSAMQEKGALSSLSDSDRKLFRNIASEITFTAKSVNIAGTVPFVGKYDAGSLGTAYFTGSSLYYADNVDSDEVKARADKLRNISGTA